MCAACRRSSAERLCKSVCRWSELRCFLPPFDPALQLRSGLLLHAAPAVVPEFKQCFHVMLPADFDPPECVPEGGCGFLPQVPAGAVRLRKGRLDALTALELRGSDHAPSESDCLQSRSIVLSESDCVQSRSMSSDPGLTSNRSQGRQQVVMLPTGLHRNSWRKPCKLYILATPCQV